MRVHVYSNFCNVIANPPSQAPDVLAITSFLVTEKHEYVEPLLKLLLKQVCSATRALYAVIP